MWPFTAHPHDLYAYTYQDPRVAALGPFFSGCFVLSVALGVWLLFQLDSSSRWLLVLASATIVASLLINKHCSWPRYGPQLWILPIVPVVFAFRENSSRLLVRLTWGLVRFASHQRSHRRHGQVQLGDTGKPDPAPSTP